MLDTTPDLSDAGEMLADGRRFLNVVLVFAGAAAPVTLLIITLKGHLNLLTAALFITPAVYCI